MKLIGYTCTFNEEGLIPYVMPYVERMGYDKFIVYDNESTDKTVELLSKYPFVEIRTFHTEDNRIDDLKRVDIHLNAYLEVWRMISNDNDLYWMSWTDFDEVFYLHDNKFFIFKDFLMNHQDRYNCFDNTMMYLFPPQNCVTNSYMLSQGKLIHTIDGITTLKWTTDGSKPSLMLVNDFEAVNTFYTGNHLMRVTLKNSKNLNSIPPQCCSSFHLKYIDKNILLNKSKQLEYINHNYNGIYLYKNLGEENKLNSFYEDIYSRSYSIKDYFKYNDLNYKHNKLEEGFIKIN